MFANWCKETTTTTGTGTLTLSAETGFPRFSDFFADGQLVSYSILDSNGAPIETGIGTYTATNTLARTTPLWTYSSSTLDTSAATAVSLSAGTYTVIATPIAGTFAGTLHGGRGSKYLPSAHHGGSGGDVKTLTADRIFYVPYLMSSSMEVDAFVVNVTTAAAGNIRIALYDLARNGAAGKKLFESADQSTGTTGTKEATFTRRFLAPGWYYLGIGAKGVSPNVRAHTASNVAAMPYGTPLGYSSFEWAYIWAHEDITAGWTDLPTTPTFSTFTALNTDFAPRIMLRGV